MSYIFVSHASADKATRVRPIVEALIAEGESVWIDRPGVGEGNFGFTQDFIARNDIGFLRNGSQWSDSLQSALRMSGAVLGCLSRSMSVENDVLMAELTIANAMGKLVTCIVDDLDYGELPRLTRGLLDLSRSQAPHIRPDLLATAARYSESGIHTPPNEFNALTSEWEKLRGLISSMDQVRDEPRGMRPQDLVRLGPRIRGIRHGPVVRMDEFPDDIIFALGDHVGTPARARNLIRQANALLHSITRDEDSLRKLILREGALPLVGSTTGDGLWSAALGRAGIQSRQTVLALLLAPASEWAFRKSSCVTTRDRFVEKITQN